MSNAMYRASVPVLVHNLKNLSNLLKLAVADAKRRGIDPAVFLNARLAPDMFPLTRQVQIACDNAKGGVARLAGLPPPLFEDNETTFEELQDRIKRTLAFISGVKPAQFEGSETREIVMTPPIGTLSFSGPDYFHGWALPNFYFHYVTAYNLLRQNGVPVGKGNFLGQVPGMIPSPRAARLLGIKRSKKAAKKTAKKR